MEVYLSSLEFMPNLIVSLYPGFRYMVGARKLIPPSLSSNPSPPDHLFILYK